MRHKIKYVGIYVVELAGGLVDVAIKDTVGGHVTSVDKAVYIRRGIMPPVDTLPLKKDYQQRE